MKKFFLPILLSIVFLVPGLDLAQAQNPRVVLETSQGIIEIELFADKAPISAKNFLEYVDAGLYNGKIFHRVIKGFMIQGGGFDANMNQAETGQPIKNEATNGLKNKRGTLAMARTSVVDSATAQFFINLVDNAFLDHKEPTPKGFGYAVFGQVMNGMDVVDAIAKVPTTSAGQHSDVPVSPVTIISARRAETVTDATP
jgi:cyclophilin family peptidyl-prolyl cis-trans isomerase